ncbi:hypothetical protein KY290_034089 [Solanum tuberosum]|uniref:Uncharacterized protein n=1 Tax=Solanum tuberosum TaxID=4113 RepID=A0ABQ7U408_SOLTU|nr:hypothetical protein KY289_033479 [Solanum tuberosum]KAH0741046.1 hypothetical protein KY290_034089 [Solanum tuberosum]KAH0767092.1 hypothetical protein KY285_002963 [Solanum tuberosum]
MEAEELTTGLVEDVDQQQKLCYSLLQKNGQVENEKAEVEAKAKVYLEKLKELESRVSLQEEEAAKNRPVDV